MEHTIAVVPPGGEEADSRDSVRADGLTLADQGRLAELEAVVERGMQTFVEVGTALMEIRDFKLYRQTHATFEGYCKDRFGFSDSRGRQLIAAAKTVTTVTAEGLPAPTTERQARQFARERREALAKSEKPKPHPLGVSLGGSVGGELSREDRLAQRCC
jgi:hypothetical protein